jgi:hypothetical protein
MQELFPVPCKRSRMQEIHWLADQLDTTGNQFYIIQIFYVLKLIQMRS